MKENRLFITVVMLWVLIAFLLGCTLHRKDEVLNFFFTGVPSPEDEKKISGDKEEKVGWVSQVKKEPASKPETFSHAPYTQRRCDRCHGKKSQSVIKKKGGVPGADVVPSKDVCLECHPNKSPSWAFTAGLWLHAPASQGSCNWCHSPHQSTIPHRLTEKISEICIQCHSEGYKMDTPAHANATECLSCHNPHLGHNSLLLKKNYDEAGSRYRTIVSHKH